MPQRLDGKLANDLRDARAAQRLSRRALAQLARVSRRHLAQVETGSNVSVLTLIRLCNALGLRKIDIGGGLAVSIRAPTPTECEGMSELLAHLEEITKRARLAGRAALRLRGRAVRR